jgi:hypothetical protein
MLINHRHQLIFVHIPKTGGGSFRAYHSKKMKGRFRKRSHELLRAHSPLSREICDQYPNYYKFAIVRNTWELLASSYRFANSGKPRDKEGLLKPDGYTMTEWIETCQTQKMIDHVGPFPRQLDYLSDEKGLLVDSICHYDNLIADLRHVVEEIGLKFDEKVWRRCNAHDYGSYDWRSYFNDPKAIEQVKTLCKGDLDYFGWNQHILSTAT